jgi:hypothetical protein
MSSLPHEARHRPHYGRSLKHHFSGKPLKNLHNAAAMAGQMNMFGPEMHPVLRLFIHHTHLTLPCWPRLSVSQHTEAAITPSANGGAGPCEGTIATHPWSCG